MASIVVSEMEVHKLIKQHIGTPYSDSKEYRNLIASVVQYVGSTSDAITLAELLPAVDSFLRSSRVVAAGVGSLTVASMFLFPVGAMLSVVDAYETGRKFYAYRAIAYTVTSWAFSKPVRVSSPAILSNLRTGFPVQPSSEIEKYNNVWRETARATLLRLDQVSQKNGADIVKTIYRSLGEGSERYLCEQLLSGFSGRLSNLENTTWKSLVKIPYPS